MWRVVSLIKCRMVRVSSIRISDGFIIGLLLQHAAPLMLLYGFYSLPPFLLPSLHLSLSLSISLSLCSPSVSVSHAHTPSLPNTHSLLPPLLVIFRIQVLLARLKLMGPRQ